MYTYLLPLYLLSPIYNNNKSNIYSNIGSYIYRYKLYMKTYLCIKVRKI